MRDAILAAPAGEERAGMRKAWKVAGVAAVGLVIIAATAFAIAVWMGERKMRRTVEVKVVPVPYVGDAASVAHGRHLYESRGCASCHGQDGAGRVFIDDPGGMFAKSPNITAGPGSPVAEFGEGDWVRAIRHGIDPKGHALLIMPSEDYNRMDDDDFADLMAYVRSLPPKTGGGAEVRLPALAKALYGVGVIRDAAETIDHRLPPPPAVPAGPTVQYGRYVAAMCTGCHGPEFSGGRIPGAPPDWPAAANLTPGEGSAMGRYATAQAFAAMLRSGLRPDGSKVSAVMPFESLRQLDDAEIDAIYAFLKTLPARAAGNR